MTPVREDYKDDNGFLVSWWQKDGAWHVARPNDKGDLIWTADAFDTKEEAIASI